MQEALEGLCYGFPYGGYDEPNEVSTEKYRNGSFTTTFNPIPYGLWLPPIPYGGGAILPPLTFSPLNDAGWIKLGGGLVLP